MDATRLSNTFTCQPQQRNMHGGIFGGFLMRRAYELAFATTHLFAGQRPRFIAINRVRSSVLSAIGHLLLQIDLTAGRTRVWLLLICRTMSFFRLVLLASVPIGMQLRVSYTVLSGSSCTVYCRTLSRTYCRSS
jgi:hypothetical protein